MNPAGEARRALWEHTLNCEACGNELRCLAGAVLEYEARILIRHAEAERAAKRVES